MDGTNKLNQILSIEEKIQMSDPQRDVGIHLVSNTIGVSVLLEPRIGCNQTN